MYDHSHDAALLQHAYYVGELEAGRRAAERLLSQSLPPDVEHQVRTNRTFYTPTLAELGPVEFRAIDIKPAHPDWSLFNPTLLKHNDRLLGLVRSSNYKMRGMTYIIPPADKSMIRTASILVEYDNDLRVVSAVPLADPQYERTNFLVDGLEDCRLYSRGDQICVSATVRNVAPHDGMCRIGTAVIDPATHVMRDIEVLPLPAEQHEKNWMPIIGQVSWLYSCGAAGKTELVLQKNNRWQIISLGPAPKLTKSFRGGSQLVPFLGGYLAAIHEVVLPDKNKRVYEHRLVWFDDQCRPKKATQPFFLRKKREIEFVAGLAVLADRVVMSFGVNDCEAWLAAVDSKSIETRLVAL